MTQRTNLAVWGDPIAHSKSPALHTAAYAALGVAWTYGRQRVDAAGFDAALGELDDTWRGLSLTMPLKEAAFRAAAHHDRDAELTGAVNTLVFDGEIRGFNTDVGGIVDALAEAGVSQASSARILGAGATAASAMVAAHSLGVTDFAVVARRPERAAGLLNVAERLNARTTVVGFDAAPAHSDVTFATLPSGTVLTGAQADALAHAGGVLFEAAYAPWPSDLAARWTGGPVVSGLAMLLHQAVRQIRIFVNGDPTVVVDKEDDVVGAMRAALVGD